MTDRQMRPDEYTPAAAIARERARIEAERPACTTAPDMTGARCTCAADCRNYWLRARGLVSDAEGIAMILNAPDHMPGDGRNMELLTPEEHAGRCTR